ncbi:protein FAM207A [Pteropus vampyrus]|uniref:Protein FAM207A n=1 Tax=Pteropus vampyrus TaxID=132908 RepID=A0A6P6BP73_PTEVA|nr:protein FAM207A [Pteropus vampyrus]
MGKVRGLRARVHQAAVRPTGQAAPIPAPPAREAAPLQALSSGVGEKVSGVRGRPGCGAASGLPVGSALLRSLPSSQERKFPRLQKKRRANWKGTLRQVAVTPAPSPPPLSGHWSTFCLMLPHVSVSEPQAAVRCCSAVSVVPRFSGDSTRRLFLIIFSDKDVVHHPALQPLQLLRAALCTPGEQASVSWPLPSPRLLQQRFRLGLRPDSRLASAWIPQEDTSGRAQMGEVGPSPERKAALPALQGSGVFRKAHSKTLPVCLPALSQSQGRLLCTTSLSRLHPAPSRAQAKAVLPKKEKLKLRRERWLHSEFTPRPPGGGFPASVHLAAPRRGPGSHARAAYPECQAGVPIYHWDTLTKAAGPSSWLQIQDEASRGVKDEAWSGGQGKELARTRQLLLSCPSPHSPRVVLSDKRAGPSVIQKSYVVTTLETRSQAGPGEAGGADQLLCPRRAGSRPRPAELSRMSAAQRLQLLEEERTRFQELLASPAYRASPLLAIGQQLARQMQLGGGGLL